MYTVYDSSYLYYRLFIIYYCWFTFTFLFNYLLYLFILLSEYSYSPTDRDRPVHGNSWENQTASWHTLVRRICLLGKGGRIRIQNKEKKWSKTIHIPFFFQGKNGSNTSSCKQHSQACLCVCVCVCVCVADGIARKNIMLSEKTHNLVWVQTWS